MTDHDPSTPIRILLVEDNPGDVRLTQEAFKEGRIENVMDIVTDGEQALAFLRRENGFTDAARPDLILLDLNLPKKGGREVLSEIKSDPALRRIPVVVLTTSTAEADILATYDLHANSYVAKPIELDDFLTAVRSIEDFWLSVVRLPHDGATSLPDGAATLTRSP